MKEVLEREYLNLLIPHSSPIRPAFSNPVLHRYSQLAMLPTCALLALRAGQPANRLHLGSGIMGKAFYQERNLELVRSAGGCLA